MLNEIDNNLYELRIRGQEEVRIFYTKTPAGYFLLHAFKKKTQEIPRKELKTAIDRMEKLV